MTPGLDSETQGADRARGDKTYWERRLDRARATNEQPWGEFLLGIFIRFVIVFAIAAAVFTAVHFLRT